MNCPLCKRKLVRSHNIKDYILYHEDCSYNNNCIIHSIVLDIKLGIRIELMSKLYCINNKITIIEFNSNLESIDKEYYNYIKTNSIEQALTKALSISLLG